MPKCPDVSDSPAYLVHKCPDLSDSGLHLPYTPAGLHHFETPRTFAARKAVALEAAPDGNLPDTKKIVTTLRVNRGHAPAQQLKRVVADSEKGNMHLLTCVDEVCARREVCQAFEKAPHAPAGGTSTVAMFNERLQVGLLVLGDIIALRVMYVYSKYSLRVPVRARTPQEA